MKKDSYFKELDFSAQSFQSLPRHYQDFKCFSLFYVLNAVVNLLRGICKFILTLHFFVLLESYCIFLEFILQLYFVSNVILIINLVLFICNYFYTTAQAFSFKSYRV